MHRTLPFAPLLAACLLFAPNVRGDEKADEVLDKAKNGDSSAQLAIGMRYRDGKGVERDFKEAIRWTRLAADQGNGAALDNLGFHYFQGWGVPQDFDVALGYFKSAMG